MQLIFQIPVVGSECLKSSLHSFILLYPNTLSIFFLLVLRSCPVSAHKVNICVCRSCQFYMYTLILLYSTVMFTSLYIMIFNCHDQHNLRHLSVFIDMNIPSSCNPTFQQKQPNIFKFKCFLFHV